jgi:hypothetical protein
MDQFPLGYESSSHPLGEALIVEITLKKIESREDNFILLWYICPPIFTNLTLNLESLTL